MTNKIYENITKQIIEKIESGQLQNWLQAWTSDGSAPKNPVTKTEYSGINLLLLGLRGYSNPHWLTFKQIEKLGGNVRKGEKSTMIIYYKTMVFAPEGGRIEGETAELPEGAKPLPLMRGYLVFNAQQCEKLPAQYFEQSQPKPRRFSSLAEIATASGLNVKLEGNRAFYSPSADLVQLPPVEQFNTLENFESVLLHELTHMTGHKTRLDRLKKLERFGSASYAFEELIAELGSAYACAKLGIKNNGLQHAEYIASWLQVLKKDNQAIFRAASEAQKACDWLVEKLSSSQNASLLVA